MASATPTASLIIRFSEAMNPVLTSAQLMDATAFPPATLTTASGWSSGNTVLTCTPTLPMPMGHMIVWTVMGISAAGASLGGETAGMFTIGTGDSGCSSTNGTMESFTVAKGAVYEQTSSATPVLNADCPWSLVSCLWLVCPHTATNVTLSGGAGGPLTIPFTPLPGHPLVTVCGFNTQAELDTAYPPGDYFFTVRSVSSNQQVNATFPASLLQPPAPHLTNYAAAQAVNPAQPFRLGWEPFAGGTAADCIYLEILPNGFQTPALGEPNALNGTATSVLIPAGTLQPNAQYSGTLTFYHYTLATNAGKIVMAYRGAATEFTLQTTGTSSTRPVITNAAWAVGGAFNFDVVCSPGQLLVVEQKSDLTELWSTLWITNTITDRFRISDPAAASRDSSFYRVRTGP